MINSFFFIFFGLLSLKPSFASMLDLSAEVQVRPVSYENIAFTLHESPAQAFIAQNARLGFILKDLKLDKGRGGEASMDVGLSFRALGIAGSTAPVQTPFDRIASRYPNASLIPFVEQAYVKANHLFDRDFSLTAGRQNFVLGTGMLLNDDGLGFTGFKADFPFFWRNFSGAAFAFEPVSGANGFGSIDVYGASAQMETEGLWEAYSFWEKDERTPSVNAIPVKRITRLFSGLRYSLRYSFMSFDGEFAIQRGQTTPAGPADPGLNFDGSAFVLNGKWDQPLGKFGTCAGRMVYGRASGNSAGGADDGKAFLPSFGHRYEGIERSGYGDLYGATLYDAIGSSSTATGLPQGVSGLQIIGLGITLPPYKNLYFDFDYYLFQADQTSSSGLLGNEFDYKVTYPVGDKLRMRLAYAVFNPKGAYPATTSATRLAFDLAARY